MGSVVEQMCDIERSLKFIAASTKGEINAELLALADKVSKLCVDAAMTIEALDPVFSTNGHNGGELTLMDLCYNAFMIGRQMENREDGGRCDWFTDTQPLMLAGVERIRKDVVQRMEYAVHNTNRNIGRAVENIDTGLAVQQIEAGAACLYGHLDVSFTGGLKVSYPQASEHTKGKYRRAFASAVRESNNTKVPA